MRMYHLFIEKWIADKFKVFLQPLNYKSKIIRTVSDMVFSISAIKPKDVVVWFLD